MQNQLMSSFNPLKIPEGSTDIYAAELMRQQVKEIIGSYHHIFDHLYECVQNAVDACERAFVASATLATGANYNPAIKITLDISANTLKVVDNGLGMSNEVVLKYFFTPYATMKGEDVAQGQEAVRQRGEKGVGATFVSYGSNDISITTIDKTTGELTAGELKNALQWCNKNVPLLPMPLVQPSPADQDITTAGTGTAVIIKFSDDTNIANLCDHGETWEQWAAILRLFTAIGYVDFDGQDPFLKSLQASLTFIPMSGIPEAKKLETGYLYPHLVTKPNVRLSKLVRKQGKLDPKQLDMEVLWDYFSTTEVENFVAQRIGNLHTLPYKKREQLSSILKKYKPEAYIALVHGVEFWDIQNRKIWGTKFDGQLNYGLVFATKSQKIGELKRIDFKFRSGDFNRFFILLNMQGLKSDIGRKSLQEEIGDFGDFFANAIHDTFTDDSDCLTPNPGLFEEAQESELEEIRDKAFARPTISVAGIHLTRVPQEEQDVIALFFDLLGSGKLRGYDIYSTHISRTYDGVGTFSLEDKPENRYNAETNRLGIAPNKFGRAGKVTSQTKCFVEFKYTTDGFVRDYRSDIKRLQDIKWLICWEIGNKHVNEQIGIVDITEPEYINQREYYGVTHIMTEHQSRLHIICLKKVISLLDL